MKSRDSGSSSSRTSLSTSNDEKKEEEKSFSFDAKSFQERNRDMHNERKIEEERRERERERHTVSNLFLSARERVSMSCRSRRWSSAHPSLVFCCVSLTGDQQQQRWEKRKSRSMCRAEEK
jgi:hypothetical protein